jgi:hypothetical protein
MTATLQRTFGVTTAEIQVLRYLASGQKVATIALGPLGWAGWLVRWPQILARLAKN